MPSTFILFASMIDDPDVLALRVGNINYACFTKDMSMLWGNHVIAKLVDEHLDRLSQVKSINDINVSRLPRFESVSVLAEGNVLLKTNGRRPLDVKEVNKLNDTIPQHHTFFITSAGSCCRSSRMTRPSHALGTASYLSS